MHLDYMTFGTLGGSGFGTRLVGNGIAGGTSSKFLGGSFQRGAILAALTVSASELVTRVTRGSRPTFRTATGEVRVKPSPQAIRDGLVDCTRFNCDVIKDSVPNVGRAFFVKSGKQFVQFFGKPLSQVPREALINPPGFFSGESGLLGFFAKTLPGLNSAAVLHDNALGQLARNVSPIFENGVVLAVTIPPYFAVEGAALGLPQLQEDVRLAEQ